MTEGQAESLRLLIKYKAKVDVKDKEGRTPMMVACVKGDVPAIQALFEAGTTVDRPDKVINHKEMLLFSWFLHN